MQYYSTYKGINLKKHSDQITNLFHSFFKLMIFVVSLLCHYVHTEQQLKVTQHKYEIELQQVIKQLEETQQRLK